MKNYYEILEVNPKASFEIIEKEVKKLNFNQENVKDIKVKHKSRRKVA